MVGPSQSGKSNILFQLTLEMPKLVDSKIEHYMLCYAVMTDLHSKLQDSLPNLENIQGLPSPDVLKLFLSRPGLKMIIIEDLVQDMVQSRDINNLFMVHSHHARTICAFSTQNLFLSGPFARSISSNCHLFFLCNTIRNFNTIRTFATQLTGNTKDFKSFMNIWSEQVRPHSYQYLLVDCSPGTLHDLRLSTDIFSNKVTRFFKMIN